MLRNRHSHVTGPKDPSGSLFGPETRENQAKGGLITAKNDGLCFENGTGRFVPARLGQLDDRVRQTWNTTTNPLEGLCAILPVALPSEFTRLVVRTPSPSSSRFAYPTACEDETFDRLHLDMPGSVTSKWINRGQVAGLVFILLCEARQRQRRSDTFLGFFRFGNDLFFTSIGAGSSNVPDPFPASAPSPQRSTHTAQLASPRMEKRIYISRLIPNKSVITLESILAAQIDQS